jgi:serine/threonine-protein kinase
MVDDDTTLLAPATPGEPPREPATLPRLGTESRRYTLGGVLGRGGMGEVVLATDEHIGREVAVKRLRASEPSAEELSRFVREARVQGRLEHPAVVPVHDLGVDVDGRPFFVMKRLSGMPLADLLSAQRDLGMTAIDKRLLRAFADVCLAVEFAHARGIVHRDLKPSNVMLGEFGEVYVLDWGIAGTVGEMSPRNEHADLALDSGETTAGTVLGTPGYMAPEQLAGERAGRAADIYALGCILYEIVAGEPLHQHTRSITSPPGRPRLVRPDTPPELDAICERATALDPAVRQRSARAIHTAVQAYLDGDRDVDARARLARDHVAAARAALAEPGEAGRRRAMQAAGRALALDPTAGDAADIVTRLMLEPPLELPAEVVERIAKQDTDSARAQGRLAALSMFSYLLFWPVLAWSGIKDGWFVGAFELLALISAAQIYSLTRNDRMPTSGIYVSAVINAALIGMVAHIVGPFIVAPTLALSALVAFAAHPRFGRAGTVGAILGAGVAVPWLLELAGVVAPTFRFHDGVLELRSSVVDFRDAPVQVAFAVLLVMLLAECTLFGRTLAIRQRAASERLEVQAWHLRQIVPPRDTATG